MRRRYLLVAVVLALLGAGLPATAAEAAGGEADGAVVAEETWRSPECEVDGSPLLGTDYCTPKGPVPQPPAFEGDPCEGLELCAATYEELEAAGHDTSAMRAADERAIADLRSRGLLPPLPGTGGTEGSAASVGDSGAGVAAYYGAWVNFHLYPGYNCDGTVYYNGYCGWLYHKYTASGSGTYTTPFPARSGNNVPSYDWVVNVGPIPNEYGWTWGFMNGSFTGFEYDYSDTFYPGKWRLDPWSVTYGGVTRGAFEIHGGTGYHDFWSRPTAGCIRLPSNSITSLKGLWDTRTDNKYSGATVNIYY